MDNQQQEIYLKEIEGKLTTVIDNILKKCYQIYGERKYNQIAKKITVQKDFDGITNPELQDLIDQYVYLTKIEEELNPFAALLDMK